jgi:hypothetical protein
MMEWNVHPATTLWRQDPLQGCTYGNTTHIDEEFGRLFLLMKATSCALSWNAIHIKDEAASYMCLDVIFLSSMKK